MEAKKKSWTSALFAYAEGEKSRLLLSVVLSVLSVMLGLVPFYCTYRLICLMAAGTATAALAVKWCLLALAAYAAKVVLFGLSTGTSHAMAYTILDEATASIDPENEHLIQQAIAALTRGKTIITIAHRLATVQNADQILVVDDGRIAQHGTHDQLVKQEGLYRRFTAIRQQAEGWRIAAE